MTMPQPGLKHTATLTVDSGLTVPSVNPAFRDFAELPEVFATAYLVAFVEATCVEALHPLLPPGMQTVGTNIEISHDAATPVGMTVTAEVELVETQGRWLRFAVACHDERDVIGSGHHERFIIERARFDANVAAKASGRR